MRGKRHRIRMRAPDYFGDDPASVGQSGLRLLCDIVPGHRYKGQGAPCTPLRDAVSILDAVKRRRGWYASKTLAKAMQERYVVPTQNVMTTIIKQFSTAYERSPLTEHIEGLRYW